MNKQELRRLKGKVQSLENVLDETTDDAELLHEEGVDTSTSTTMRERQIELQDEMEQLCSDILALLESSDTLDGESQSFDLPDPPRTPVSSANLPEPTNYSGQGRPPWSNSGGNSGNGGN